MSAQPAAQQPPPGLKRSGSINLLRGRTGSLRRRDGHKRVASNQAMPPLQNIGVPGTTDGAWNTQRPTIDKRPVVSYAVTITSGGGNETQKPKEKRRMFGGFLHKRSQSKGILPQINEAIPDTARTPKKSITPAIIREDPRESRRPSRGHSRSASALSFFHNETALPLAEAEEGSTAWAAFAIPQKRPGTSEDTKVPKQSPMMLRYNPAPNLQRKPVFSRQPSDESTPSCKSAESKPERPMLRVITDAGESVSAPQLDLHLPFHPPRKSSLPGGDFTSPLTQVEPERPGSSKEALAKSFEVSAQHRRQRSKDIGGPIGGPAVNIKLEPIGPTPPPKDNDKGYYDAQIQQAQGLPVTIPERSPLRIAEILHAGNVGPHVSATDGFKSSTRSRSNGLPSPSLSNPRRSELASRRRAIPSTIQIISRPRKQNIRGVLGSVLSPSLTPNRVLKSQGSSRGSSRISSPAIGKVVTSDSARVLITAPPVPARKAPPPPLSIKVPQAQRPRVQPLFLSLEDLSTNTINASIIRAPVIPEDEQRPTPPAKSPKRLTAMKRRSVSDGHIPIIAGRPSSRRKSVHRRKPTGFRLTKEKEEVLRRGRQADRPAVPPSLEQTALAMVGKHRSPSPKTVGLTPPQSQGEWQDSRGRRQPSPLRSGESVGAASQAASYRPDASRSTTETSGVSTITSASRRPRERDTSAVRRLRSENKQAKILGTTVAVVSNSAQVKPREQRRGREGVPRPRAPSHTAMLPLAINPLASHPLGPGERIGQSEAEKAAGRAKLLESGHKVTAEESIKRMIERQEQQAVAMRMKLLGLGTGQPVQAGAG